MDLIIDYKKNGSYDTELYNLLANIPEDFKFYNGEHKLATPLSIYNKSIKRVLKAFEDIVDNLNIYYNAHISDASWENIDAKHKELLDSIMSFIDDGYHIMKCFYSKSYVQKNIKFADKWLSIIDGAMIQNYQNNIEPYRKKLALIDNKIKHNHARYYHVICVQKHTRYISSKSIGYYIAGIDEKGTSLPDEEIHSLFNGMSTAISYNKDIPELLANVYFISYYTARIIKQIINKDCNINININKVDSPLNDSFMNVLDKVNSMRKYFFPDEYNDALTEFVSKDKSIIIKRPVSNKYLKSLYKAEIYEFSQTSVIEYGKSICLVYKK